MTTAGTTDKTLAPSVRLAVVPSLGAGLLCAAVGAVRTGPQAGWGALVGTAMAVGFFWLGHIVLNAVRPVRPDLFLVAALATYTMQVVALFAVLALFDRNPSWTDRVSSTAIGVSIIVVTAVWSMGLVVASKRHRAPLYDLAGGA